MYTSILIYTHTCTYIRLFWVRHFLWRSCICIRTYILCIYACIHMHTNHVWPFSVKKNIDSFTCVNMPGLKADSYACINRFIYMRKYSWFEGTSFRKAPCRNNHSHISIFVCTYTHTYMQYTSLRNIARNMLRVHAFTLIHIHIRMCNMIAGFVFNEASCQHMHTYGISECSGCCRACLHACVCWRARSRLVLEGVAVCVSCVSMLMVCVYIYIYARGAYVAVTIICVWDIYIYIYTHTYTYTYMRA